MELNCWTNPEGDGRPWLVGLTRFPRRIAGKPLDLSIYPLRKGAPVFFEPGLETKVTGASADTLEGVDLVTEYRTKLRVEPVPSAAR